MKPILLSLVLLLSCPGMNAQDQTSAKESRKEASQRKKAEKEAKIDSLYRLTGKLLETRRIVLEATTLSGRMGRPVHVSSILNFVAIDSDNVVLQVGSVQAIGYNGVGGITAQGRANGWRISPSDKQKMYDLFLTANTNKGVYDIHISIDYSGYATATLTGYSAGQINFTGNLVPVKNSGVYKGQSY
ncbi:MAG TPA: DUF4251 domain-containing protein [Bacteroidales bacterium]|nr:DUF4251 domain-containing protein [Bacteroidales bacterium]